MRGAQEPVRLFFALWPDPALQQQFYRAGKSLHRVCGGRQTRCKNIHLTLAFLGEVEAARLERVKAIAAGIEAPVFSLTFTRLGWWRSNQVAWAATEDTPRPLMDLVRQLRLGLAEESFKFDERRYLPHVTLLRKAQCGDAMLNGHPLIWQVREFALVRSTLQAGGPHYAMVGRWPLKSMAA